MNLLWVTSFNSKIAHSGNRLIQSFYKYDVQGKLFVAEENISKSLNYPLGNRTYFEDITDNKVLVSWLQDNSDIIPVELGGNCSLELPWFNRHASRWFRKIIALQQAFYFNDGAGHIIWIDADSEFTGKVTEPFVRNLLFDENRADIFYMRGIRKVIEAGLFGLNMSIPGKEGETIFEKIKDMYLSANFRGLPRWDDSYIIQHILEKGKYKEHDIVKQAKAGKHASVIEYSLVSNLIKHHKGSHGRIQGIYK